MPVTVEAQPSKGGPSQSSRDAGPLTIGLVNNMPDSALEATERQFRGLLESAAGDRPVHLRLSFIREVPRSAESLERLTDDYWPFDELLSRPLDALIVTGTEPRAPLLASEPYWNRILELIDWADRNTTSTIWSCLAAHAAVEALHGIRRTRLATKRFGVYEHSVLAVHPLMQGISSPLATPQSRWNDLSVAELEHSGYTMASSSPTAGANVFTLRRRSLFVFLQGHPEYDSTTLLKEYRRDVGRYLSKEQSTYPQPPANYLSEAAMQLLRAFEERATADREPELLGHFPMASAAAMVLNSWRPSAVQMYRNWLAVLSAREAKQQSARI